MQITVAKARSDKPHPNLMGVGSVDNDILDPEFTRTLEQYGCLQRPPPITVSYFGAG
jgi:hypothetical protein